MKRYTKKEIDAVVQEIRDYLGEAMQPTITGWWYSAGCFATFSGECCNTPNARGYA